MYATVDMHFSKSFVPDALVDKLPRGSSLRDVIPQTVFQEDPSNAETAFYARLTRSAAVILLPSGEKEIQAHVEAVVARGSVIELKSEIERALRAIQDASKASNQSINSVAVTIYAENNRVTAGAQYGILSRMLRKLKDAIFGDVVVVIVPVPIALFFGLNIKEALVTALAACISLIIWLAIEAAQNRAGVVYEDV